MNQKTANFRFYEELNDFLPTEKKKRTFTYKFSGNPTVKDAIEACGVPHPEVEIIIINRTSVDFNHRLQDGDRVAVYPMFESLDISPLVKLRPKPLRIIRFILDTHLGKLAKNLRMLGFDVLYDRDITDQNIIKISTTEARIILTRDQGILKHKTVTHGYWIRSTNSFEQIKEVLNRFDLISQITPFIRCMECNGILKPIKKEKIIDELPPKTIKYYSEFYHCPECKKIYWPGSHFQNMNKKIERLKRDA